MNISAHGKYPVRHKNMWHGGGMITVKGVRARRMITDKGVRAGINPAPTLSLQCEYFKGLCL